MSTLKADTIQSTGGGAATLTKQAALKCFFKTTGTYTGVAAGALNVSSVSDIGTGDVDVFFTNAFANSSGMVCTGTVSSNAARMCTVTGVSTTQTSFVAHDHAGGDIDNDVYGKIVGDLA